MKKVFCQSEEIELGGFGPGNLPNTQTNTLNDFDQVWIRKDPPFDLNYVSLCWLLMQYENIIPFINPPSRLIAHHEKFIPLQAVKEGFLKGHQIIPTWKPTKGFRFPPGDFPSGVTISKPWLGHGGIDIQRWDSLEIALGSFPDENISNTVFQPFDPAIYEGDRRVFFINGKIVGSLLRLPKKGSFISNLSQGGEGILKEMDSNETDLCNQLSKFLVKHHLFIAGVDLIGNRVSEVNVTAPTGVQQIKNLGGPDIAEEFLKMAQSFS